MTRARPARVTAAFALTLSVAGLIAAATPAMGGLTSTAAVARGQSASTTNAARPKAPHKHKQNKPSKRQLPMKMVWGPLTLPDGASAFPTYHQLGVQVLETQLIWARTAPTQPSEPANPADPAYRWPPELEQMISQAAQYGIAVAVMVKGTPGWANSGRNESWAPNNAADYASFVQAASRRYPAVHYWMIWGETNGPNFNPNYRNSPVGPRRYALMLDAAYGALKAVSSANIVIGGMTWTGGLYPAEFIHWMRLPDGAPPRLDYYGHNPYSTRFPNLKEGPRKENLGELVEGEQPHRIEEFAKQKKHKVKLSGARDINDIDTLHSELAAVYRHRPGGTPKLWLSEFSISSDRPNRAFVYFVSRAMQARWVTAAFKLVDSVSYVAGLGWYDLADEPASVPFSLTEGLLTENGTHKPAFSAYAHAR